MGWTEIEPRNSKGRYLRRGGRQEDSVRINLVVNKASRNVRRKCDVQIRIGAELAKQYRLLIGDRVKVLMDFENRLGCIVRVTQGGFTLSAGSSSKSLKGQCRQGFIKISRPDDELDMIFPNGVTDHEAVATVETSGIVFELPPTDK